jgi:hypothetical protein
MAALYIKLHVSIERLHKILEFADYQFSLGGDPAP